MNNDFTPTPIAPKTQNKGMGMLAPPNDLIPNKGRVGVTGDKQVDLTGKPTAQPASSNVGDVARHSSGAPVATVSSMKRPTFTAPGMEVDTNFTDAAGMPNSEDWISDKATVQGQAMGMLEESDSNPLYKYYQNLGEETAGARGWDNSDMQTKAGLQAAYENVIMPTAQQDASLYGQAALKNQELAGTVDVLNTEGQWDLNKLSTKYGFQAVLDEWTNFNDQRLARYGYDRQDRQLFMQLNAGLASDMIDFSGAAVNNNDLIVTDGLMRWGSQWIEEYLDFDFDF